jgi:hypothetical protein
LQVSAWEDLADIQYLILDTNISGLLYVLFKIRHSLAYSCDGFSLFIRDGDVKLLLELHDELNGIE